MATNDDEMLVAAWKNGDDAAFEQLFKRYFIPLCEHAYSFLRDPEDSKDIVQQVFTSILSGLYKNIAGATLKGYLYTAVTNRCLRELQIKKKHHLHHERIKLLQPQKVMPLPESQNSTSETKRVLSLVIDELPKQRKRAVELFYLHGLKKVEVAEQMGIGVDTVKSHLQLALATLRKRLKNFLTA